MKAVDLVASDSVIIHQTTPTKLVEPRKNGYINGLHYTDQQQNSDGSPSHTDEEDLEVDDGDCGVTSHAPPEKTNGVVETKQVNGISNGVGKQSIIDLKKIEDLKTGRIVPQPDVILTNGLNRSEVNGGFYLLSNGRTKKSDVATTHTVDLLCGDPGAQTTANGNSRLNEAGVDDVRAGSPTADWDRTVAEMKGHAVNRLQDELRKAHQELKLRDEEVSRLSRIREEVEAELEDLTASLFQEAHNMVREANVKQASAERAYKESEMKIEVLTAEVSALKALVLTSTPSKPNPHLHPQIDLRGNRTKDDSAVGGVSLFNRKHRRSPSHFNLKYGRENSPPESPVKEPLRTLQPEALEGKDGCEVDPDMHKEFVSWKDNPKMDKCDPFIARVYREEIDLCLNFPNQELSGEVRVAVESGNVFIEAVSDKSKTVFPKKCALLDVPRQCHYRMKFGDQEQWYCMSQICRNRIIAVCDFLNYLKYIERGLVKSSVHDVYWEVMRLRKEMVLARLGLALAP